MGKLLEFMWSLWHRLTVRHTAWRHPDITDTIVWICGRRRLTPWVRSYIIVELEDVDHSFFLEAHQSVLDVILDVGVGDREHFIKWLENMEVV